MVRRLTRRHMGPWWTMQEAFGIVIFAVVGSPSCWRWSRCSSAAAPTTRSAAAGSATTARSGPPLRAAAHVDLGERDDEIRQMLAARNARHAARGEAGARRRGRARAPHRAGRRSRPARGGPRAGDRPQLAPRGQGAAAARRRRRDRASDSRPRRLNQPSDVHSGRSFGKAALWIRRSSDSWSFPAFASSSPCSSSPSPARSPLPRPSPARLITSSPSAKAARSTRPGRPSTSAASAPSARRKALSRFLAKQVGPTKLKVAKPKKMPARVSSAGPLVTFLPAATTHEAARSCARSTSPPTIRRPRG